MKEYVTKELTIALLLSLVASPALLCAAGATANSTNYVVVKVASTVPPNGDVNPYGVAVVQHTSGNLIAGDVLVSNFNNSANLQGTGTTIMEIAPNGAANLFAWIDAGSLPGQCPGGVGLTTALVVLRTGWVIVGSLPTTDGTAATAQAGCLIVLNNQGAVVETITNILINGPWDMTALDEESTASLFVTNVLNGTVAANGAIVWGGTVVRINTTQSTTAMPAVQSMTAIGSGFAERTDPAALVIGPTGVALAPDGTLYVADSLNNRIVSIGDAVNRSSSAQNGQTLSNAAVLNDPLGLAVRATKGDILSVNGNNGLLVVLTSAGQMKSAGFLDNNGKPPGAGALFGLADSDAGLYFVDDGTNTLNLLANPL
jgi:hypothetical protein